MNRIYEIKANSSYHAESIVGAICAEKTFGDGRLQGLKAHKRGAIVVLDFTSVKDDGYATDRWEFLNRLFSVDRTR